MVGMERPSRAKLLKQIAETVCGIFDFSYFFVGQDWTSWDPCPCVMHSVLVS